MPGSLADEAGLRPGDLLLSINSHPLHDVIDFMFYNSADSLDIKYKRKGSIKKIQLITENENDLGLTIQPFKVKTCKNNCLFCFVKQLPKGFRKSLYIKDEDYRLSFLYGNYITFSNLDSTARKRIIEQRLSPLYVSVHSTRRAVRNRMLGNPKASDIMKELKFFSENRIRMHTQIVLCPGLNDGMELRNTIKDIFKFYPYTSSIAVVPVGLTTPGKLQVEAVTKETAMATMEIVKSFQKRFKKNHGDPVVYCSDEMYIKAGQPFPRLKEYGSLPQIENGVGMTSLFIHQSKRIKTPKSITRGKKLLTFTGASFYPFLKKFTDRLSEKEGIHIDVISIENNFFGPSITVTGLLTGRDVIKALHDNTDSYEVLIVPDSTLKEDEDIFLDDVSLKDIEEASGLKTVKTVATPQGLIDTISSLG